MPSPFPGMDPYLEHPAFWSGFHSTLIVYLRSALSRDLPPGYYADVEQHVWLEEEDPDEGRTPFAVPDAYIAERHGSGVAVATLPSTVESAEISLPKPAKRHGTKFIKIVDQPGNRIITVIEVLSPSNKDTGQDRDNYISKRNEYLSTRTNLVEIDLLRDGARLPFGRPHPPLADYYSLVSRVQRFPKASFWAFSVRDPMPRLPIPLKPEHGDVVLDLRTAFDRAYDDGGYATRIDYAAPPAVGLRAADAGWAVEWLTTKSC